MLCVAIVPHRPPKSRPTRPAAGPDRPAAIRPRFVPSVPDGGTDGARSIGTSNGPEKAGGVTVGSSPQRAGDGDRSLRRTARSYGVGGTWKPRSRHDRPVRVTCPPLAVSVRLALALAVALLVGACAAGAATPGPTTGPRSIESAEQAAAAVKQANPLLTSVEPLDPELIGQSSSWEAVETDAGWELTFVVGWGDCIAGCISRHTWRYTVTREGAVTLVEESGEPLPGDVLNQLGGGVPPGTIATGVRGLVLAGPVCPVERIPPDPGCAPRPVEGAVLIVRGADGAEAGRAQTDGRGFFELPLDPGSYTLEPQPVEGLMATAAPLSFTVEDGASTPLTVEYDTGIR